MNPVSHLWRKAVRTASGALLERQDLTPEALRGRQGEELAYWHLRHQGFIIVARNYRPQGLRGEIDLIGWEGDTLVFVEVKTRGLSPCRLPEAAVDREKEGHVIAAAREYRRRSNRLSAPFRFDIVSVITSAAGTQIEHFRDAFREGASSGARK